MVEDEGSNQLKQTAQFGQKILGGTETPKKRGNRIEAALQIDDSYGMNSLQHKQSKTEAKEREQLVQLEKKDNFLRPSRASVKVKQESSVP